MDTKSKIFEALGATGQAAQKMLGGDVCENAGAIFEAMATHPDFNAKQVADLVRGKIRRETGGKVYSGRCGGKRIARLADGAAVQGEAGDVEIDEIGLEDPAEIACAADLHEFCNTEKGRDIVQRAQAIRDRIDALKNTRGEDLAKSLKLSRRAAFLHKSADLEELQADLDRLRRHFLWAQQSGLTETARADAPKPNIREAVQCEFEFEFA